MERHEAEVAHLQSCHGGSYGMRIRFDDDIH